jgi:hypothetical protein
MSTVSEVEAILPTLTTDELLQLQRAVHHQLIRRINRIIYDDVYGLVTEREYITSADEAFQIYDKAESEDDEA